MLPEPQRADTRRKLILLIEPASYVLDFLRIVGSNAKSDLDVYFVSSKMSQPWAAVRAQEGYRFLPSSRLAACRHVWQLISGRDITLVHTAGWSGLVMVCAWLAAWRHGVPLLVESDTPLERNPSRWSRAVRRLLYPWWFRLPAGFLPAGSRQRRYLEHYGVASEKIVVHQMTVDVRAISARVHALRKKAGDTAAPAVCRVLFVGRLEPRKGLASLLDAFRVCRATDDRIELHIAGDGSLRSGIEAAAAGQPGVRYLGRLEGDALMTAYATADIFVCPSLVEPWGLVVNEAMASGLPIIATDRVGCVDDLVREGCNGFIVPAGDVAAIAEKLHLLAADTDLRRRMGAESRRRIQTWTMQDQARIIRSVWSEVAS